ncbi:hypothetical protein GWI33_019319 [Rhynchophorus ferrugineus]|uniref:DUF4774 domain-containing protein n=1 Tax=Rhynchophorus ferrugineus TaxID=354439 RepID=A0A834HTZ4_RHYFE|nr:hypothetical protein GWI33_019319 [Rhynchophorus ferrugineus]
MKTATRIILVPFYGGAKGQSLQITETTDGQVLSSVIVKTPNNLPSPSEQTEIEIDPLELENPPLPSKFDIDLFEGYEYIKNIQKNAGEIVKLQEKAKRNGELTESEETKYNEHMSIINSYVQKLAEAQENSNSGFENREGLSSWFDRQRENTKKKTEEKRKAEKKKEEEDKKRKEEEENKKKEEEIKRKKEELKEQEKEKEKEKVEEEEEEDNDAVAINLPPDDASVAEAKPIGLAVAGDGGVAASKPIATAVVGPGGLAIARPVATAIAGVSPDQALVPVYVDGSSSHKKHTKNKSDGMNEFLSKIITKYHHS